MQTWSLADTRQSRQGVGIGQAREGACHRAAVQRTAIGNRQTPARRPNAVAYAVLSFRESRIAIVPRVHRRVPSRDLLVRWRWRGGRFLALPATILELADRLGVTLAEARMAGLQQRFHAPLRVLQ